MGLLISDWGVCLAYLLIELEHGSPLGGSTTCNSIVRCVAVKISFVTPHQFMSALMRLICKSGDYISFVDLWLDRTMLYALSKTCSA